MTLVDRTKVVPAIDSVGLYMRVNGKPVRIVKAEREWTVTSGVCATYITVATGLRFVVTDQGVAVVDVDSHGNPRFSDISRAQDARSTLNWVAQSLLGSGPDDDVAKRQIERVIVFIKEAEAAAVDERAEQR